MAGVASKIAQKRTEAVAEVLEQLQSANGNPHRTADVRELVAELVDLAGALERASDVSRAGLRADTAPEQIAAADDLAYVLNSALRLFPRARKLVEDFDTPGRPVDGLTVLDEAEARVTRIREDHFSRWLVPDEQRVKLSRQQLAEGKFRVL